MGSWKDALVNPESSIINAMKIIDESSLQIALVVDQGTHLVGVVTDGDIRRGVLKGLPLDQPVKLIMNTKFMTVSMQATLPEILSIMKKNEVRQIPVVDAKGYVVDLKVLDQLAHDSCNDHTVVLMAGGLGTRLQPLTDDCPKPLLKVGSKPLLETILDNFREFGFKKFYIAVNHMAEMIKFHIGDGSRWDIQIDYLHEGRALGTAGALSLLPVRPELPVIVMNADVLTKVNFRYLLDFHQSNKCKATMGVRDYHFQVPFGVVRTEQHRLLSIDEKPSHSFFVNAGVYVLDPEILDLVSKDSFLDMTDLFEKAIAMGHETAVFPIREYWIDVGRVGDYERANGEFPKEFG